MMKPFLLLLVALWSGWGPSGAHAESLFESNEVLELAMPVDFADLCRPSETPDCGYWPTVFRFTDADGNEREVSIEIRRRDGWRSRQTNCQVPTLFVRFVGDAEGTPFEGQPTLALTSHCGKGIAKEGASAVELPSEFERYVVTEYLGYRLYNLVTDLSLRVRLVRIRYEDPDNPRRSFTRDAFFSEHFDSLATRAGARLLSPELLDPKRLDLEATERLALFQFMVGNTDWSIERQDNIVLLGLPDGRQVPVLFDLDLSGLVNPHYARPPEDIPVRTVTQRYFLGYCHRDADWDALFEQFAALRPAVGKLLASIPGLGRGDRRVVGVYLDSFFKILNSPERRTRDIVNACRDWPGSRAGA